MIKDFKTKYENFRKKSADKLGKVFSAAVDGIARFTIKGKIGILIFFLLITALCAYGITLTSINSNVLSYLPAESNTSVGMNFFGENFNVQGNIVIAVDKNTPYEQVKTAADRIKSEIPEATTVLWIGSIDDFANSPMSVKVGNMPVSGTASELAPDLVAELRAKASELLVKDGNYVLMITLSEPPSNVRSIAISKEVHGILEGIRYAENGVTPISVQVYTDAIKELPYYVILAIVLVLIILILTSSSYVEPIIFLATLGVAIVINMGTNFIFGEVSIITFCASAILQLALSMDYAIFLTHMYKEQKLRYPNDSFGALSSTLKRTIPTVCSSGLTTIGGLAALFLMSFTIGVDLGGVLLKGIVLSLITVFFMQPCLLLLMDKLITKTAKKPLDFKFHRITRFSVQQRLAVVALLILLIAPSIYGQIAVKLSYLDFLPERTETNELTEIVDGMSNQMFIAAPYDENSLADQVQYCENLSATENISSVTGLFGMLPSSMMGEDGKFYYTLELFGASARLDITEQLLTIGEEMGLLNNGYAMYLVAINDSVDVESPEATTALFAVRDESESLFGDACYVTGIPQGVYDFQTITPKDFGKINIVTVVLVFAVLVLTFGSLKYPLLLMALIELGLCINFSLNSIFGASINFLSDLVVGSIQLGATIDYAILVTGKYRELRKEGKNGMEAAYYAGSSCSMSVLTSASIMITACVSVAIITNNAIIREIALMVARGALISCILVLCALPAILALSSSLKKQREEAGGIKAFTALVFNKINQEYEELKKVKNIRQLKALVQEKVAEDDNEMGVVPEAPKTKKHGFFKRKTNESTTEKTAEQVIEENGNSNLNCEENGNKTADNAEVNGTDNRNQDGEENNGFTAVDDNTDGTTDKRDGEPESITDYSGYSEENDDTAIENGTDNCKETTELNSEEDGSFTAIDNESAKTAQEDNDNRNSSDKSEVINITAEDGNDE